MYRPSRMGNGIEIWGVDEVKEKFEVNDPLQVIDFLGMMGDAIDNIPGLPGVGEKTAKKFLAEYGSMENLLANTGQLKGKMKERVEASKEIGLLSKNWRVLCWVVRWVLTKKHFGLKKRMWRKTMSCFRNWNSAG